MRLFLDANVIFSAAVSPGGRARGLFRLARHGRGIAVNALDGPIGKTPVA